MSSPLSIGSRIEKEGKIVAAVYVCGSMVVVKSVRTGKLQEFGSVEELKRKLEPLGCKLVVSYANLPELQKLAN